MKKVVDIMTNKKETKKEFFLNIMAKYPLTDYEKERFEHEIELLEKKNSAERKPSKVQLENEAIGENMLDVMEPNVRYTVSDLCKLMGVESTQKMTPIATALYKAGKLARETEKRRNYYFLP